MATVICPLPEDLLDYCKLSSRKLKAAMSEVSRVESEITNILARPILTTNSLQELGEAAYKAAGVLIYEASAALAGMEAAALAGIQFPSIAQLGCPITFTGCTISAVNSSNKFVLGACNLAIPATEILESDAPWSANAAYQDSFYPGDIIKIEEIEYGGADALSLTGATFTIESISVTATGNEIVVGGVTYHTIKMTFVETVLAQTGVAFLYTDATKMATKLRIRKVNDLTH
jgi:hypothetical protein